MSGRKIGRVNFILSILQAINFCIPLHAFSSTMKHRPLGFARRTTYTTGRSFRLHRQNQGKMATSYYDDYEENDVLNEDLTYIEPRRPGETLARYPAGSPKTEFDGDDDYYDGYNYYEDDEELGTVEDEDDDASVGNYWSNPTGGIDRTIRLPRSPTPRVARPRPRKQLEQEYYSNGGSSNQKARSRRTKKSQIKSNGLTQVPEAARDLYERLFWYGFDPDETADVGDKTVFGGTKGKFNGLAYLQASDDPRRRVRSRQDRQLPSSRSRRDFEFNDVDEEVNDDDMLYIFDDEELDMEDDGGVDRKRTYSRRDTPPEDSPMFPRDENQSVRPRGRRQRSTSRQQRRPSRSYADDQEEYVDDDWVSRQVSSWFSGSGDDGDDDGYSRQDERKRRINDGEWSPFNVLDTFLGLDREEMAYKAEMYNAKMGIGPKRRTPRARSESSKRQERRYARENRRRPGYAYPYSAEEDFSDDQDMYVLDVEPLEEEDSAVDTNGIEKESTTNGASTRRGSEGNNIGSRELTWEERALAVERVPPPGISAWGPSGEFPMDGRTKAIMDALEDIQTARQKLEAREKREALAREEITILKVDGELQRRQLEEGRSSSRRAHGRLHQIELETADASRALRRARTRVKLAQDQLEELKERHWAVLSFYNPDQAEEKVNEALNEYQLSESTSQTFNGIGNHKTWAQYVGDSIDNDTAPLENENDHIDATNVSS